MKIKKKDRLPIINMIGDYNKEVLLVMEEEED